MATILKFRYAVARDIEHVEDAVTTHPAFNNIEFDTVVTGFTTAGRGVTSFKLTSGNNVVITFYSPSVVNGQELNLNITQADYNPKYAPEQTVIDYVYNLI